MEGKLKNEVSKRQNPEQNEASVKLEPTGRTLRSEQSDLVSCDTLGPPITQRRLQTCESCS